MGRTSYISAKKAMIDGKTAAKLRFSDNAGPLVECQGLIVPPPVLMVGASFLVVVLTN